MSAESAQLGQSSAVSAVQPAAFSAVRLPQPEQSSVFSFVMPDTSSDVSGFS